MLSVKCDTCNSDFEKESKYVKDGKKNYCCKKCQNKGQRKGKYFECSYCGEEVYRSPAEIKKSKSGNFFCNKSCSNSYGNIHYRNAENSPNWKDGSKSYRERAFKEYDNKCNKCGFDKKAALQVHHIDENRSNNKLENLEILCANCHCMIHYEDSKTNIKDM